MQAEDAEVVDRYLKGEAQAVGTVDGWIARAAYPYQRRLSTRWDDTLQEIHLEALQRRDALQQVLLGQCRELLGANPPCLGHQRGAALLQPIVQVGTQCRYQIRRQRERA